MNQKRIFIQVILLLLSVSAIGQVNFFTDDSQDSLATNFYQRNKRCSVLIISDIPSLQTGAMVFFHNKENRASYFVSVKSNGSRRYVVDGEECYGDGVRQKELAYTASSVNVGLARGFTRNWFLYGGFGMLVKRTHYTNVIEDNYRYHISNQGVWLDLVGGTMYVADNGLSIMAGMDLSGRSVTIGLGYTW